MGIGSIPEWWQVPAWGDIIALVLSLVFAAVDIKSRRIPNMLTMGGALGGLVYQVIVRGWPGLATGGLGLVLGLALLMIPYIMGGTGAGDVKALGALGTWLGPMRVLSLFCYMALAGGLLALGVLLWRGTFWFYVRQFWWRLMNFLMTQDKVDLTGRGEAPAKGPGIPYGVAIALGMLALLLWGEIV